MKQSDISLSKMNELVVLPAYVVLHVIASTATNVALDSEKENHFFWTGLDWTGFLRGVIFF